MRVWLFAVVEWSMNLGAKRTPFHHPRWTLISRSISNLHFPENSSRRCFYHLETSQLLWLRSIGNNNGNPGLKGLDLGRDPALGHKLTSRQWEPPQAPPKMIFSLFKPKLTVISTTRMIQNTGNSKSIISNTLLAQKLDLATFWSRISGPPAQGSWTKKIRW